MTANQIKELLKKVELLEVMALVLHKEAEEIKVMLSDIVDPENKKTKASFERARKKALKEQERAIFAERFKRELDQKHAKRLLKAGRTPEEVFRYTGIQV